jgi:hypothetical protein
MIHLHSVIELYITNECNLTCSDCNRYNNYDFAGHYDWRDSEQAILAWGKRINAPLITIIGGEPMMHPELFAWVKLACRAWPQTRVMVQTNGTVNHPDAEKIRGHSRFTGIVASLHQPGMQRVIQKRNGFFRGLGTDIIDNTEFMACALRDQGTHFDVHDSDPVMAFNACGMKYSHTILNGKLYKCPMVAVLPEFIKQYAVKLTERQRDLLMGYSALDSSCDDADLLRFLENENHCIPQCNLCPDNHHVFPVNFDPSRKHRAKIIAINTP